MCCIINIYSFIDFISFSTMASSDDEDDRIIKVGAAEADNHYWLPIIPEQDGQGMFFPELSPSPPPPPPPQPIAGSSMPMAASNQTTLCEWTNLINEYETLVSNKASIDRRRFNKSSFELLNRAIILARQHLQNKMHKPNPMAVFGKYRDELLSDKEMKSEELVEHVVAFVNQSLPPLLTADERKEELQKKSMAMIQDISPQMSVKLAPIIKSYISRQFGCAIEDLLADVSLPSMSLIDKTNMYTRMLNTFLDDASCLSFALSNRQLLGNISPVDLWFLTFFAFVTVRRCRGDNLLMLGCVGKSNCPL